MARVYDDLFVPTLFGRFSQKVAESASIGPADAVLDVACGTGALTRELRRRTTGRVVGLDANPAMPAVADAHGGVIEYIEGDATALPFLDRVFAAATCRFGLMFMPDPGRALAEMGRVAGGGNVAVWDAIERSSGYSAM